MVEKIMSKIKNDKKKQYTYMSSDKMSKYRVDFESISFQNFQIL